MSLLDDTNAVGTLYRKPFTDLDPARLPSAPPRPSSGPAPDPAAKRHAIGVAELARATASDASHLSSAPPRPGAGPAPRPAMRTQSKSEAVLAVLKKQDRPLRVPELIALVPDFVEPARVGALLHTLLNARIGYGVRSAGAGKDRTWWWDHSAEPPAGLPASVPAPVPAPAPAPADADLRDSGSIVLNLAEHTPTPTWDAGLGMHPLTLDIAELLGTYLAHQQAVTETCEPSAAVRGLTRWMQSLQPGQLQVLEAFDAATEAHIRAIRGRLKGPD